MGYQEDKSNAAEDSLGKLKGFSLATFFTTLVRFSIRLVKNIITTRILGPNGRGIFSLLTTIPDLMISFGSLGFGLGNAFLVGKKKYDLRKVFGNTLLMVVLLGLCLAGVGYFFMSFKGIIKGEHSLVSSFRPLVLFMVPIVLLHKFCDDLLLATQKIHFLNRLGLCISLFPCIILPSLWFLTGQPLSSAMYAWFFSILSVTLLAAYKLISLCDFKVKVCLSYMKESLHFGGRGLIGIFCSIFVRKVDFLFISSMLGATELGFYAISVSIGEILISLQTATTTPFMSIRYGLDTKDAAKVTPIAMRHVVFFSIVISLFIVVFGKPLIFILFGESFLPAYQPALILLPGIIALCIHDFVKFDLYSQDFPQKVSMAAFWSLVCNICLNFILIPVYGINGAALSSSISYSLATVILLKIYHASSGLSYREMLVIKKTELAGVRQYILSFMKNLKPIR